MSIITPRVVGIHARKSTVFSERQEARPELSLIERESEVIPQPERMSFDAQDLATSRKLLHSLSGLVSRAEPAGRTNYRRSDTFLLKPLDGGKEKQRFVVRMRHNHEGLRQG
jgi:hypothetical protein